MKNKNYGFWGGAGGGVGGAAGGFCDTVGVRGINRCVGVWWLPWTWSPMGVVSMPLIGISEFGFWLICCPVDFGMNRSVGLCPLQFSNVPSELGNLLPLGREPESDLSFFEGTI
jgi:hypothetical protein